MFTIGEFSRLSHVSARMLRHYDAIGLLRPAHVGMENGYRYYTAEQLSTLVQIETLKDYGFPLAEIPALLGLPKEELADRMHKQRLKAYAELNSLRKTLRRMEDDIVKMEDNRMSFQEKYHIITMQNPEQRVFSIRRTIAIGEVHDLFQELLAEMEKRGLKRTGPTQMLYHGEEFSYEDMDAEAQVQVDGEGEGVTTLPAQLCAAVTHIGPYDSIRYAYDALCAWLAEHTEYRVCGPAIERYIRDENMAADPEEYETGVLFPIEKVK